MTDTEDRVKDLVRKFEFAASVVESLHPDVHPEFIRKNSIGDVMNKVDVEMIQRSRSGSCKQGFIEKNGNTMKRLEVMHQSGEKPHTIGPSRKKKNVRNKVTRSKTLSFKKVNLRSSKNGSDPTVEIDGPRNLLAKKNSIDEESTNLTAESSRNLLAKTNSIDEESTNPIAETSENFLAKKNSIEEESTVRISESSSNLDPVNLKGVYRKKSFSGTLKSLKNRLSTKRTQRKSRSDIRNIEFDGEAVNSPDSDSVILGSENSSILNKCTVDDGVAPNQESLHKLSSVTFEGPLVSRHIAVSLFDKLAKKSSSLSTKIIPVVCYLLRQGSNYFKMEVQYKRTLIVKLMESSLACQGTVVHELYKELVELIEYEYKKSLLGDEYTSELRVPECISLNDIPVRTKGDITREVQIEAIVSPEKRIVDQITTASCIEPLPPMTEIWKFAAQYKQLNQHAINMEIQLVLQGKEPMCQLRALSVVDYLSQHYHNSCQATFLHVVKEIAVCDNMDLKKKAQRILSRLSEDNDITPCPTPPRSPYIGGQTHSNSQNNLVSSHMKRSYDKILPSTVGYQTMTSSDHVDETLLDLGSPCSSNSYNASPASSPSRHRFLSFFSPPPSRQPGSLSRRGSADSSDSLLGAHLENATPV